MIIEIEHERHKIKIDTEKHKTLDVKFFVEDMQRETIRTLKELKKTPSSLELNNKKTQLLQALADLKSAYPDLNAKWDGISPYHFLMIATIILPKETIEALVFESQNLFEKAQKQEQENLLNEFLKFQNKLKETNQCQI